MVSVPDARVYPRVLCLAPSYAPSGTEAGGTTRAALDDLARALDGWGVRQVIVCARRPGSARRDRLGSGGIVRRLGVPAASGSLFGLAAATSLPLMARTADILHLYQDGALSALPLAAATASAWDIPLVVTLQDSHLPAQPGDVVARARRACGRALERGTLRRASAVIVPDRAIAERLATQGGSPQRTYVLSPGGADSARQLLEIYRAVWARHLARRVAIWHPTTG